MVRRYRPGIICPLADLGRGSLGSCAQRSRDIAGFIGMFKQAGVFLVEDGVKEPGNMAQSALRFRYIGKKMPVMGQALPYFYLYIHTLSPRLAGDSQCVIEQDFSVAYLGKQGRQSAEVAVNG